MRSMSRAQLRPLLQDKGFKVVLTRENDVFHPAPRSRPHRQRHQGFHFRQPPFQRRFQPRSQRRFEIFSLTPRGAPSTDDDALALHFVNMQAGSPVDAQSFELSATVFHSMLGHLPEVDRGIKRARFAVLRHTKIPAILVEGGFLSETGNSKRIADPAWREKFAESLCRRHRELPQPRREKAAPHARRRIPRPGRRRNHRRRSHRSSRPASRIHPLPSDCRDESRHDSHARDPDPEPYRAPEAGGPKPRDRRFARCLGTHWSPQLLCPRPLL